MRDQIAICDRVFSDLEKRFDTDQLALIHLQYPNPRFKGPSLEEAAIKNHPRLKRYYQFAPLTKGREFWAGAVLVPGSFMSKIMSPSDSALRANMFYVAMSRFRDELVVVYCKGTQLSSALAKFAQLHL